MCNIDNATNVCIPLSQESGFYYHSAFDDLSICTCIYRLYASAMSTGPISCLHCFGVLLHLTQKTK